MTVYCEDCTHATNRGESVYKWRCLAVHTEIKETYVRRKTIHEPLGKCCVINKDGDCRLYESLKRIENDTNVG